MDTNIEHEGKVLNIVPDEVRRKLESLKAVKVGKYNYRRYVFDTLPPKKNQWVRLRSDGRKTTLAVKEIQNNVINGTLEWEVAVSDMKNTLVILEKIGIIPRGLQENRREEYRLDNTTVCIDFWPKLNPYVEVEGDNSEEIIEVFKKLGYSTKDIVADNTDKIYKDNGYNLDDIKILSFEENQA